MIPSRIMTALPSIMLMALTIPSASGMTAAMKGPYTFRICTEYIETSHLGVVCFLRPGGLRLYFQ